jgi:twinkle protein
MYYDKLVAEGIKLHRTSGSEKTKCPKCSDGRKNKADKPLSVNVTTGEYNCHNCGWKGNVRGFLRRDHKKNFEKPDQGMIRNLELKEKAFEYLNKRGLSRDTLERFMIFTKEEIMPQTSKRENCICFPYMRDGELINVKFRDAHKNFRMVKDAELIFYNLQTIGDKKYVIITEGEIDCMSVYEAGYGQDAVANDDGEVINDEFSKWAIISVPNGASKGNQKMEYLDNCSDWLIGVHEFVIATDGDDAGMVLKDELIRRLGVERCRVISYPLEEVVYDEKIGRKRRCKDFNEVLTTLGKDVITNCINNSEFIPVDGIYYLDDIFPTMLENFKKGILLAPTTRFACVDEYFRWKKGEINLFTGYGNHGKTTFAIQLMLIKSIYDGWKWAIFSPENYPANDFYDDIVEMYAGKWLNQMTEKEYIDACWFIDKHIFYVYPEDEHDINSINEKFRHLVLKKGVDGVMIDPWNQLDHIQRAYQREDQYLSEQLKNVKRFALLNNVCYNIVAHPVKPQREQDKSLPVVDMYDIHGGSMWGNKADNIISYYRPQFHVDKNSPDVEIFIQKIKRKRTGGSLGSFPLRFNWNKKRFSDPLTGESPCDPYLASKMSQSELFGKIEETQPKEVKSKNWYERDSDDIQNVFN